MVTQRPQNKQFSTSNSRIFKLNCKAIQFLDQPESMIQDSITLDSAKVIEQPMCSPSAVISIFPIMLHLIFPTIPKRSQKTVFAGNLILNVPLNMSKGSEMHGSGLKSMNLGL